MKPFLFSLLAEARGCGVHFSLLVPLMSGLNPSSEFGVLQPHLVHSVLLHRQISAKSNFVHYEKNECQMCSIPTRLIIGFWLQEKGTATVIYKVARHFAPICAQPA